MCSFNFCQSCSAINMTIPYHTHTFLYNNAQQSGLWVNRQFYLFSFFCLILLAGEIVVVVVFAFCCQIHCGVAECLYSEVLQSFTVLHSMWSWFHIWLELTRPAGLFNLWVSFFFAFSFSVPDLFCSKLARGRQLVECVLESVQKHTQKKRRF